MSTVVLESVSATSKPCMFEYSVNTKKFSAKPIEPRDAKAVAELSSR